MMLKFVTTLKKPWSLSLLGHFILLLLLMMEIPHEHFGFKNQMQPVKIITATAINSQQVERKAEHLQDEIQKQRLEIQHEKQEQEVHQREEQRRLVQVKAQQEKERLKQEVLKMAALEKQRKLLEKKELEEMVKEKKVEKVVAKKEPEKTPKIDEKKDKILQQKKEELLRQWKEAALKSEQAENTKKLQEIKKQLNQKLMAEEKAQLAKEQTQREQMDNLQGIIDQFKSKILQAIGQNWLIPEGADHSLSCQLLIHLAPDGSVLGVDLIKSSGDAALDQSAETAVMKASPLPVPLDAVLFDKFRELRLTVRPEEIIG